MNCKPWWRAAPTIATCRCSIRESRFFQNIARRSASGEAPRRTLLELEDLPRRQPGVWENSWVRFPRVAAQRHALQVFQADLQVVRTERLDRRTLRRCAGSASPRMARPWLRIPISYALKLSLADLVGTQPHMPEAMRAEASRLMRHFLNDNTSPETTSFHIVAAGDEALPGRAGRARGGPALSVYLAADFLGEPSFRPAGKRPARARLSRARAIGASGRAVVVHLRLVLSRAVHEPLPLRMERRRSEISSTCTCATRC